MDTKSAGGGYIPRYANNYILNNVEPCANEWIHFTVHDTYGRFPSDVELSLVRRFIVRCHLGTVLLYRDTGGSRTRPHVGSCCLFAFVCLTQKFIKCSLVSRRGEAAVGYDAKPGGSGATRARRLCLFQWVNAARSFLELHSSSNAS